ncbi:MAG: hypothetical protein H6R00_1574 [Proteobacteria bacterium]|nr:hypothetical protein [Pseudomonadota bacterium]
MRAAGQQRDAAFGVGKGFGLRQDAAADGDHRVGGQHQHLAARIILQRHAVGGDLGFGAGETAGKAARQFGVARGLVDVGRQHQVGRDAELIEQRHAARARRGQDQDGTIGHRAHPRAFPANSGSPEILQLFFHRNFGRKTGSHFC